MALFPEQQGDTIPGGGEQSLAPSAPAPQGWPASVPFPGPGTPLEDFSQPSYVGPQDAHEGASVEVPGTLDEMPQAQPPIDQPPPMTGDHIRQILEDAHGASFSWRQIKLPTAEERRFRREMTQSGWYKTIEATFGIAPNLADPSYDYRAAWKDGSIPKAGEQWPTSASDGSRDYISPEHPYAPKARLQRITGHDASEMHDKDYVAMMQRGLADLAMAQQEPPPQALPGHAVDQNTGRQMPLSSDPKDAVDPRPRSLGNNRMSKRPRYPEDEPGILAPKRPRRPEDEPGVLTAQGPDDQPVESEEAVRARAQGQEAFLGFGGKKATDAGKGPVRGFGPGGQYTKDEWEYIEGSGVTKEQPAAPAVPAVPASPAPPAAPPTVGESRKSYMQKRLQDIQEGR